MSVKLEINNLKIGLNCYIIAAEFCKGKMILYTDKGVFVRYSSDFALQDWYKMKREGMGYVHCTDCQEAA